jgi:large subunit ribosomal protein L10
MEVSLSLDLQKKEAVVAEVAKQVATAQAIVLAENRGMPVSAMTQLRAKARASGVYFRVVKNTLVRRAVGNAVRKLSTRYRSVDVWYQPDSVAAKVLNDFAKTHEKFVIMAVRWPEGDVSLEITALAGPPSRDELLSKRWARWRRSPLVRTMNEVPGKFVRPRCS